MCTTRRNQAPVDRPSTTPSGELPFGQREIQRMPRFGLPQFTAKRIAVPEHSTLTVSGAVAQSWTMTLADLAGLPAGVWLAR